MANRGGDSKKGLIIALVCSILLVIILGAVAYSFYSDIEGARKRENDAQAKASAMQKDRDWYKWQSFQLKNYLGVLEKDDDRDFDELRTKNPTGPDAALFQKTIEALKAKAGEDPQKGRAREPFVRLVGRLETDLAEARKNLAKEQDSLAKERDEYKLFKDTKQQEVDELKKKFDEAQKTYIATQKALQDKYQKDIDELGDLSKQLADFRKKADIDIGLRDKDTRQLKALVDDMQREVAKLQEKITPPDLLKFSPPKGKIVRLEPRGEMAWINLGSADGIRPQQNLTFSIFGAGTDGHSTNQIRKGALEVVNVIEPHFSMAKITEVVDPARNPLLTGDLLINPAWSPQLREHVAIAGLIDLTGDGNDYSEEFMRNLRKQGVVIDEYLDLKDLTVKGPGITLKTNYLILGEQPETTAVVSEGDKRTERKNETFDKIAKMTNDAKRLGVSVVSFRRFVDLTGYRLPRGANVQERFNYDRGTSRVERKEGAKKEDKPASK